MRLATDPNPKKEKVSGENREFYSEWTDFFAFTTNAADFKYQININIPLQSSSFDVIHINACSFRPIRNVHMLI